MMRWRQFAHNILFLEAFQCTETNGSNGIDETDLVFLTGILSHPSVTQKFKVSRFIDPLSIDTMGKLFFSIKLFFSNLKLLNRAYGHLLTVLPQLSTTSMSGKEVQNQFRILLSLNYKGFPVRTRESLKKIGAHIRKRLNNIMQFY